MNLNLSKEKIRIYQFNVDLSKQKVGIGYLLDDGIVYKKINEATYTLNFRAANKICKNLLYPKLEYELSNKVRFSFGGCKIILSVQLFQKIVFGTSSSCVVFERNYALFRDIMSYATDSIKRFIYFFRQSNWSKYNSTACLS